MVLGRYLVFWVLGPSGKVLKVFFFHQRSSFLLNEVVCEGGTTALTVGGKEDCC